MLRVACVRSLVLLFALLWTVCASVAQIAITVALAPPELPVYEQPPCPGEDYFWTPGYWAWDADGDDYYWVPGTWVPAPEVGYFWTPPYWGWGERGYVFYPGYWGPHIGFYGGIVYGFGYWGHGYDGGRWYRRHFFYNRSVTNVNVTIIHNVYNETVETRDVNVTRVSYNGGNGGINARPTAEEESFANERRFQATSVQTQHIQAARGNAEFRASVNRGNPPVVATERAGEFSGRNAVAARAGGHYTPPPNRGNGSRPAEGAASNRPPTSYGHVKELPPMEHSTPPNSGNAKLDEKYQQQQQKLYDKQNQERQRLQQQQENEHQKFQQKQANQAKQRQQEAQRQQQQQQMQQRQQQMEQRHQQQTQQMVQRHAEQQQHLQQRQASPPSHASPPAQHHSTSTKVKFHFLPKRHHRALGMMPRSMCPAASDCDTQHPHVSRLIRRRRS